MTPEEDKNAQKQHADKISVERQLMRMTGMSRGQIRNLKLREGLSEFFQRSQQQTAPVSRARESTEVKEEITHHPIQNIASGTAAKETQLNKLDTYLFIWNENGIPTYFTVAAKRGDIV